MVNDVRRASAEAAYLICRSNSTLTTAPKATTPAAMASPTSRPLRLLGFLAALAGAGRWAPAAGAAGAAGRGPPVEVAGRDTVAWVVPGLVGGRGGAGVAPPVLGGTATERLVDVGTAGGGGVADPMGPPPAGSMGSLIVGDAVGFGGKLMRTVSFLG